MNNIVDVYPFLTEIPDSVLSVIDLEVLHRPLQSEKRLIKELSEELKKNVVVYKKDHICKGTHLCRILQPASLTAAQLDALYFIEKLFSEGQVVVAYEKPLTFAIPSHD